jgi:AcrR family transcriptional regulator
LSNLNRMDSDTVVDDDRSADATAEGRALLPARDRILHATFDVLVECGYARATTQAIAARAKVSKRELYALFGNKQGIVAALIETGSLRMHKPLTATVESRTALTSALAAYGFTHLREVCQPGPLAMYRLALAEAERSPELAQILSEGGREANRRYMIAFLAAAKENGLLPDCDSEVMTGRYFALLWSDLLLRLLMRVIELPAEDAIRARAEAAVHDFLKLYPAPH